MIALPAPIVRIIKFERLAACYHERDTLLGRIYCEVNDEIVGPITVHREADKRLIVSMPFTVVENVDPYAAQLSVTLKVERYMRFLIREEARS